LPNNRCLMLAFTLSDELSNDPSISTCIFISSRR
jgi:hypothetical protein